MEYMIGEFNFDEFIEKNYNKIRKNCIADMVLIDAYSIYMGDDIYNSLFNQKQIIEREKLKLIFSNLFFLENSPVVHQGFYRYLLNTDIQKINN